MAVANLEIDSILGRDIHSRGGFPMCEHIDQICPKGCESIE